MSSIRTNVSIARLCEPECPVEAIYSEDELPAGQEHFLRTQCRAIQEWPVITEMKDPPEDADDWRDVKDKLSTWSDKPR